MGLGFGGSTLLYARQSAYIILYPPILSEKNPAPHPLAPTCMRYYASVAELGTGRGSSESVINILSSSPLVSILGTTKKKWFWAYTLKECFYFISKSYAYDLQINHIYIYIYIFKLLIKYIYAHVVLETWQTISHSERSSRILLVLKGWGLRN